MQFDPLHTLTGLARILSFGLVIALSLATWLVMHRLRRPARRTYAWAVARSKPGDPSEAGPPNGPRAFRETALEINGRSYPAWDISGDEERGPIVIASPGWGDSKIGILARTGALGACASRIFAWDSPGLGEAPGKCPQGAREGPMLAQIIDRVRDEHGADTPVILYGWSMGAGTSLVAAAILGERGDPVRAVVCEAPYRQPWTPALNVMRLAGLPWRINGPIAFALMGLRQGLGPTWRGFDRAKWAARVSAPVLVVHGTADAVCPVEDGRAIAEAAPNGSILEIDGAGHNDLWTDERYAPEVGAAVRRFVGTTLRESSPAPEPRTLTT